MIETATSLLWDNSTKLLETIRLILDPKTVWLSNFSEDELETLAPLIWGIAPGEAQKELLVDKIAQAKAHRDIRGEPIEEDSFPSGTPEELFEAFLAQIDNWLNHDEVDFIQKSWEARNNRIKRLIKERDEAIVKQLASQALYVSQSNTTHALRLAEASYNYLNPPIPASGLALGNIFQKIKNGRPIYQKVFRVFLGPVYSVAFSQTEPLMALGSEDGSLTLWNHKHNQQEVIIEKEIEGPPLSVNALAFSPKGDRLFIGKENNVFCYDLKKKKTEPIFKNSVPVSDLATFPDSNMVLAGYNGATLDRDSKLGNAFMINVKTKNHTKLLSQENGFTYVAVSPNGKLIATSAEFEKKLPPGQIGNKVTLWQINDDGIIQPFKSKKSKPHPGFHHKGTEFEGQFSQITAIAFSDNAPFILTACKNGEAILWEITGEQHYSFRHEAAITSVGFINVGSEIRVFTSSEDKTAVIWTMEGKKILTLSGHQSGINAIALSADGNFAITGGSDNSAIFWDLRPLQTKVILNASSPTAPTPVTALAVSREGSRLLIGRDGGPVLLHNFITKASTEIKTSGSQRLVFYPDDPDFFVAVHDFGLSICDLLDPDNIQIQALQGSHLGNKFSDAQFSPDGKKLLTSTGSELQDAKGKDYQGNAILWELIEDESKPLQEKQIYQLEAPESSIYSVAISSVNDQLLLGGALWGSVCLYDFDGNLVRHFNGLPGPVTAIAFSPDGKLVAAGGLGQDAIIWNLDGEVLRTLKVDSDRLASLQFSPDGQYLITLGKRDHIAYLWNMKGQLVQTYRLPAGDFIKSITFSADSARLYTGSNKGLIHEWFTPSGIAAQWLRTVPVYKLTNEEWEGYGVNLEQILKNND